MSTVKVPCVENHVEYDSPDATKERPAWRVS